MSHGILALAALASLGRALAAAAPLPPEKVPQPLKPWIDWALRGHEQELCPTLYGQGDQRRCAWPARLSLVLEQKGGRFSHEWRIEREGWVALPGEPKRWPQNVRVDGAAAAVAPLGDSPGVFLRAGDHRVDGTFAWDALPESIQVPVETGLVALISGGRPVPFPNRDASGRVWLQKAEVERAEDRLDIVVHRRIVDDIPLQVLTRVELRVSGSSREIALGKALLDGFTPMLLESPLPARLERDGRLRAQVRPGSFAVELTARSGGPIASLSRGKPGGPWPAEETWAFESRNELRLVSVEGVTSVDPQQTTLPEAWRNLPAYRMGEGDTMRLVEKRRGDSDPGPDRLSLSRRIWLDFDGGGYTVEDEISGAMTRGWRLTVQPPMQLGRVAVDNRDQFITVMSPAGIEVRKGRVRITADSRLEGRVSEISAVGWDQDFVGVTGVLQLPPGWRLFSASGADGVRSTWVSAWTLLDLFLVLIIAFTVARLWGIGWGAVALLAMVLTFTEPDAPQFAWLAVLAGEALSRVLPEGRIRRLTRLYRVAAWGALAVIALPFLIGQARQGMHPALENPDLRVGAAAPRRQVAISLAPAAPAQIGEMREEADESLEDKRRGTLDDSMVKRKEPRRDQASQYAYLSQVDPNSMVQTGPGVPRWEWNAVALSWSGPVERTQMLKLRLVPPWANFILAFARVALVALLFLCLIGMADRFGWRLGRGGAAIAVLLALCSPAVARAEDLPDPKLIDELRKRMLEPPECLPHCASSSRLRLEVATGVLRARMEASAAARTAIPLPGGAKDWLPSQVLLDGKPARGLDLSNGSLWLELDPGSHLILLEGPLPDRETVQIPLPLKPHRVEARAEGWTVAGIHEDGLADDNLQLTRLRRKGQGLSALQPGTLPPFVRVERHLFLGLTWEAETRVARLTPTGSAVVLEVPLLAGESVTSAEVRVERGKALVNMAPLATEVAWRSRLEPIPRIKLAAQDAAAFFEVWRLDVAPLLHVELSGIAPVHQQDPAGARVPEWRPWPGETVEIAVSRPEGLPGQTLTIDRASLDLRPGARATDATLALTVRSSRGGQHAVTLPDRAQLQSVSIGGKTQPIRQEKLTVTLPIVPGEQSIALVWREPRGVSARFSGPAVDLGAPSANVELTTVVPDGRWTLFLGGPRVGPAVSFWSLLVVLLLAALGLGRIDLTPLRARHWVLLGLGLSQVPVLEAAVAAAWLLAIGWRREHASEVSNKTFDILQVLLIGWTAAASIILLIAIRQGLLGAPDMQIAGNGSTHSVLRWFADRSGPLLPQPWVFSVPQLVYRLAMLAWALWLAFAMLRWLPWAFQSFVASGAWRPFRKPRPLKQSAPAS